MNVSSFKPLTISYPKPSTAENLLAIILGTVIPLLSLIALFLLCYIWPVGSGGFLVRMTKVTENPNSFVSGQA